MTGSADQNKMAIRVAVLGVGRMGRNHLRIYSELKNAELVGFYDPNYEAASDLESKYKCSNYSSMRELADDVDAVSICTPSITHAEIGKYFLDQRIHCLIEKPLATSENDCLELIRSAENSGVALLVGHIERFNPVVQQLTNILSEEVRVYSIDARRLSSVGKHITDVDVVADLMVHDLDIILSLVDSDIVDVTARSVSAYEKNTSDYVTALITFANGTLTQLTASRITQNRVREIQVTTDHGIIVADYSNQNMLVYQQGDSLKHTGSQNKFGEYIVDTNIQHAQVHYAEPLQIELRHFINVVRNDHVPMVTATHALESLRLVWKIQEIIKQ